MFHTQSEHPPNTDSQLHFHTNAVLWARNEIVMSAPFGFGCFGLRAQSVEALPYRTLQRPWHPRRSILPLNICLLILDALCSFCARSWDHVGWSWDAIESCGNAWESRQRVVKAYRLEGDAQQQRFRLGASRFRRCIAYFGAGDAMRAHAHRLVVGLGSLMSAGADHPWHSFDGTRAAPAPPQCSGSARARSSPASAASLPS